MTEIGTFIVNAVTMYGLPFACAILFIGSLGAPFPCTIIVILLGAFVRDGILNPYIASSLALVSCVSGDLIIYGLGRMGRSWIPRRIQFSAKWINVENAFNRHAGIAVYMTRWFMTPLAFPTTLIAGNGAYSFPRFLSIDALGQATWIVMFGGLGYAFSSQSDLISEIFSSVTGVIVGAFLVLIGAYALFKFSSMRLRK